jgi:GNAT superfamily N-acetyltransferase/L-amino acid N-acyltransferase YncA
MGMTFEVRSLQESEREECLALWNTVWPGDGDGYFRRYFYGDVEWLPYYTRVGVLDGRLVSAVQICKRTVACGDYRLTMGGIANVATLPEFRGHGYNTRCLQSAIEVMEADAMDFSLLFTGINGYYAREGFDTIMRRGRSGTIRADVTPASGDYTVREAEPADVEAIYRIYDSYNRERPIAVQRTPAYWRDWIGTSAAHLPPDLLVAVDRDGMVRGYVQSGVFRSAKPYNAEAVGVRIIELGVERPGDELPVTRALLEAVAVRSLAQGGTTLKLNVGDEPAIDSVLADLLAEQETHESGSGMARLLHRENLLRGFAPQWNERWLAADRPQGRLDFTTPYGPVRIDATGNLVRVAPVDEPGDLLPQAMLFALLFGVATPQQVTEREDLHPLLAALFPRQGAIYYGADGF